MSLFSRVRSNLPVPPVTKELAVYVTINYGDYTSKWFWEFDSIKGNAKKYYEDLCQRINATKDGDFVVLADDLIVRRENIVEVYYA